MKKNTIIFIILSGVASFFNYITYPILARVLNDVQFVNIAVALAIFTQLSSFMLSIVAITIGLSKQGSDNNSNSVIEKLQAVLAHLFFIITVLFLVVSPFFLDKLHLPAHLLFPICIMLALAIPVSVVSGFLNGKQKLVKLGIAITISATLQLVFSISFGVLTRSGAVALNGMALGAFVALIIIYRLYRGEGLPRLRSIFLHGFELYKSVEMRELIKYMILSSLAILIINILLIIDLLLVNSRQIDTSLYTDLYVISRIVFFGGTLFVWPFLSNVDIQHPKRNIALLLKISTLFLAITICAILIMLFFSTEVTRVLLGSNYNLGSGVKELAISSILYKFIFLMITALTLFFIVLRSYWAIWLPLVLTATIGIFVLTINDYASTFSIIFGLNIAASIGLLFGLFGFMKITMHARQFQQKNKIK